MKLQTYSPQQQISLINTLANNSSRAVTLTGVWESTEPSFKKMEIEYGIDISKKTLLKEIIKLVVILKADMQEVHIDEMVNYIMKHYPSYGISDITCLKDRLLKNNPYGKPILQNLIHEIDLYSVEKQEYAVQQRIKENSIHKSSTINLKEDKFAKMYQRLKEKAKIPELTQKEKDAEAIAENNRKAEELKKMYG